MSSLTIIAIITFLIGIGLGQVRIVIAQQQTTATNKPNVY